MELCGTLHNSSVSNVCVWFFNEESFIWFVTVLGPIVIVKLICCNQNISVNTEWNKWTNHHIFMCVFYSLSRSLSLRLPLCLFFFFLFVKVWERSFVSIGFYLKTFNFHWNFLHSRCPISLAANAKPTKRTKPLQYLFAFIVKTYTRNKK